MNILITGSNGCIGTRLTERLLAEGHNVTGIDIKENAWSEEADSVTRIIDLRNPDELDLLDEEFDLIIHLAAHPYVHPSVLNPMLAYENFQMLFNILEYARKHEVKNFMFSSSREVYGNIEKDMLKEEDSSHHNAESPYTATKIGGEALIQAYSRCYGINHMILRFSNVYGMYDESDRVIPKFIRQAKAGEDLVVYGKEKLLDFTYMDDLMDGMVLCIKNLDRIRNETFNLSGSQPTKIMVVAELINQHYGRKSKIVVDNPRTGEVIRYVADLSKAKKMLNYNPKVPIERGIANNIHWYEKHAKTWNSHNEKNIKLVS